MRIQTKLKRDSVIGLAVSGGKDSIVLMHLLHGILEKHRDVKLVVLTVDEGIEGYRPDSIDITASNAKELGLEHKVASFKEMFGVTMDSIAPKSDKQTPCSYCGVFRRRALNELAKAANVDRLALGHNLDDCTQSILMNLLRGDVERLARMSPHERVKPGLIPRMLPLRTVPEKECYLYALFNNLTVHHGECPYSERALRGTYRNILYGLEEQTPGTRHTLLSTFDRIKPLLADSFKPADLNSCISCGEPTPSELCKACQMQEEMKSQISQ